MAKKLTNGVNHVLSNGNNTIPCEEIQIPVPWGHISGKWWGARDAQPVLAIHGWQDNAGTYDKLAPLLCKDIPIFCIDLPGHGLSSHYPKGQYYYVFWDGILVIRRIVKFFKWKKVKLMGHSLGGAISFLYAASYPEETVSYVCIDVASPSVRDQVQLVTNLGKSVDTFFKYETLSADKQPSYNYQEMIDLVHDAYNGSVNREGCEIMMKRGMQECIRNENTYKFMRDIRLKVPLLGFFTIDQVMEFAGRTICPVLNIRADPGQIWPNPEHYDMVLDKIKETSIYLERHIIKGMHHLHLNDPECCSEIIRKFLINY